MNDTTDIIVAQQQDFSSLEHANAAGYFRPWQLKRRELKPDGSQPRASLFDAVAPDDLDDFERGLYLASPDLVWIGDNIGTNRRALYHISQTKPYHPTERTMAVWTYQDAFVAEWKRYRYHDDGRWYEGEASVYRDGLNETKIKDHLRGLGQCQVYAGRHTRFVAARVQRDAAEWVLARAEEIKERLFAKKWLCQASSENVTIYWLFRQRTRTEYVVRRLRQCLGELPAAIGPTSTVAIDLPLSRGCLTFVDRLLPTVQHRTGPEEDVVGFAEWITGEAGNPTPADVVGVIRRQQEEREEDNQRDLLSIAVHFAPGDTGNAQQEEQRQQEEREEDIQRDLLSIAVQFDQTSLKNRFWRVITGFFQGRESLPLNTAILLGARVLHSEGVAADTAQSVLLDYSRSIPNPTSSRLTDPAKCHALENDIRRTVEAVYQNNGRQQDTETSTQKMRAVVVAWRSKGLIFSDKTTWGMSYGYAAVPEVEFTDQERRNIKAYLLPVLSRRDTKGSEPWEVAVKLADRIVRLVAAKEKHGTGISTSYLQQYIKGETGICCENKRKFGKIKEAIIALGFIKVLRQGRHRCGATYYGLAGRFAETEQPSEKRLLVNEGMLDAIIRPIEEQVEEEEDNQRDLLSIAVQFAQGDTGNTQQEWQRQQEQVEEDNQRDLLSIAVQFPDPQAPRVLEMNDHPVFKRLLPRPRERQGPRPFMFTGDPIIDEALAELWAME